MNTLGDFDAGITIYGKFASYKPSTGGTFTLAGSPALVEEVRLSELAILISCVGRKLVLKQRVEEEVEAVRDVLGPGAALAGFYSYGEISPFTPAAKCELHNQTMTITTLSER